MEVFVKAAETGSFAAAAAALGISRQMVTKHIVFLEHRVGTALLNRTTRKQSLTEFGRCYLERCRQVVAEAEAADALAAQMRSHPHGTLRINAPVTFGTFSLTPLVTRFLRAHPEVDVDLSLSDRLVDLTEEGFEAVIRLGPLADSTLTARALAPYRLIACAALSYLAERGTPSAPAELAGHECLGFAPWSRSLAEQWRFTRGGSEHAVPVKGRFRANDSRALLQAALDGFGIALGAETMFRADLLAGHLVRLLPDYEGPWRPMHIVYSADRRLTPKLRLFIEAVVAEFGPANAVPKKA